MFDSSMRKQNILLFFSVLALIVHGHAQNCATQMGAEQLKELRIFQQQLGSGTVNLRKKATVYIPVKIHIVGNSSGIGYYSVSRMLEALCDINHDFIPTGFHFYLADSVDYINDDALYQGSSDAIWNYAENYKMDGVVNIFFHGVGSQWCGVYFPGVDVVFIKNYCQSSNSTTLTHELGHFFSLPHTFYGWENNNTPVNKENINGSNCRTTGDGFCDTKPDYVSQRWTCPLAWTLTDPNNVPFKPDSSIYMSYSYDACQSRFSEEQMAAMRYNVQQRGISTTTANITALPAPVLISPINGDTNQNASGVRLKWHSVPGAFAYYFQVARFGAWEFLNADRLVFDTTTVVNLYGKWPYAWRVKAITAANTCTSFGVSDTFITYEVPAGYAELRMDDELSVYPNPVYASQTFRIRVPHNAELVVTNALGQLEFKQTINESAQQSFSIEERGMYILNLNIGGKFIRKKLLVQ